jgi:hypothetical protein
MYQYENNKNKKIGSSLSEKIISSTRHWTSYYLINKVFIFMIYTSIVRLTSINLQNKNS